MSAAPHTDHQVRSAVGAPPASPPADEDAPVLSLVRPRAHPHPVAARPASAEPRTVTTTAGAVPASDSPLAAEDRALLTSMAPALATALVEVLVGARAAQSVERWVEGSLYERIVEHTRVRSALAQGNPHADRPIGVSVARLCEVADSIVEISLVVRTTRRPRALALRMERRRSRWRLSEFLSI